MEEISVLVIRFLLPDKTTIFFIGKKAIICFQVITVELEQNKYGLGLSLAGAKVDNRHNHHDHDHHL